MLPVTARVILLQRSQDTVCHRTVPLTHCSLPDKLLLMSVCLCSRMCELKQGATYGYHPHPHPLQLPSLAGLLSSPFQKL